MTKAYLVKDRADRIFTVLEHQLAYGYEVLDVIVIPDLNEIENAVEPAAVEADYDALAAVAV